jgi:hypothetical protein
MLLRDESTRYYRDQHLSLGQIDRRAGLSRGSAAWLARQYAIPLRGGTDDALRVHPGAGCAKLPSPCHHRCGHRLVCDRATHPRSIRRRDETHRRPLPRRGSIPGAFAAKNRMRACP